MAHTFVTFNDHRVLLSDHLLIVVARMTAETAAREPWASRATSNVRALLDKWGTVLNHYAVGAIDLHLDTYLKTDEDRRNLIAMLEGAKSVATGYQPAIPKDYLNRVINAPGILAVTADFSSADAQQAFDAVLGVLTTPDTPPIRQPA